MKILQMLESPKWDSRIKTTDVSGKEKWLGYLLGPCGALLFNAIMNAYLNVFYTDVLGATAWWGGAFLIFFPVASKIFDAITNVIMGSIISRTKNRQGKLRPYILLSAPVMVLSGIMLYAIPQMSQTGQIIWVIISYNLYYAIGYTMYNISHNLMVPNSTRNTEQRTQLGVFANISSVMVAGMFGAFLFPVLVYPHLQTNADLWLPVMSALSLLMLPLTLIEYFYTRERITEENIETGHTETGSLLQQCKIMLSNKHWVIIMTFFLIQQVYSNVQNMALPYYCNWTLADTYTNGGYYQSLLSVIGGFPMGIGILAVWPLAKKFGKRNLTFVGLIITSVGCLIGMLNPSNIVFAIAGNFIRSVGSLPVSYVFSSMLADVLDEIELENDCRVDGASGSVYSILGTVGAGVGLGVLNGVLAACGYQTPSALLQADGTYAAQSLATQNILALCYFGFGVVAYLIMAVLVFKLDTEKDMPRITAELEKRKGKKSTN